MRTFSSAWCGILALSGACTVGAVGDDAPSPDGSAGGGDPVAGAITTDQAWSGAIALTADVTIEAGVTVTVAPGTAITAADGATLRVAGALEAVGTEAARLSLRAAPGASAWAGIVAEAGGAVHLAYADGGDVATLLACHAGAALCRLEHVDFTHLTQAIVAEGTASLEASRVVDLGNGGVTVRGDGDLHVVDSYVYTSSGDLVVASGGTLLVEYSEIGDTQGSYDHCDTHIDAAASLTITHTNLINGVVGMMLGGTDGATITYDNWTGNDTDLEELGANTNVDLTHNYWEGGAPALGAAYDVSNPAPARIADAGPRL